VGPAAHGGQGGTAPHGDLGGCVWQAPPRRRGGLRRKLHRSPHALPSPSQTLPCPPLINPYDWSTAPHHVAYTYDTHTGCGLQRMGGSKGNSSTSPPRCCAIDIHGHAAEGDSLLVPFLFLMRSEGPVGVIYSLEHPVCSSVAPTHNAGCGMQRIGVVQRPSILVTSAWLCCRACSHCRGD
jgi:hypothetical protein